MNIDKDAFSSGQIGSKIWLCKELERLKWLSRMTYIYGGWHGILGFLLLSRGVFEVNSIRSLDVDSACESIADTINENWVWQEWKFKAFTQDCNTFDAVYGDLIINTSTEHFISKQWFDNIPIGTRVILQGNNMPHADHHVHSETLENFVKEYPLSDTVFTGQKEFVYPDWSFKRYMLIGVK
jgi:hypothetical protein